MQASAATTGRGGLPSASSGLGMERDDMLAIAILGLTVSGRDLLIAAVVIVVIAAIGWFLMRRR